MMQQNEPRWKKRRASSHVVRRRVPLYALAIVALQLTACHRSFYRQQADEDVYTVIAEKAGHPHWPMEKFAIDLDPRSRMFDPFDPDGPPMPPDDPVSHELMHYVDGKKGYPRWHENGDVPFVENPAWMECLPLDERGVLKLDSAEAVRLALLHSPNYQEEFEDLYLSALDVTAERFIFDSQFFGGYGVDYRASGRASTRPRSRLTLGTAQLNSGNSISSLGGPRIRMERAFTSGSSLVVGLANQLVWNFAGPDTNTASTIVDFSLVQPLLRGAGRDRIMETLTRSERALLANVRQMERYRRGFYLSIATGQDAGDGASRIGGFFGGSGLAGFSGVGGGGFGGVGGGVGFGGGGAGGGFGGGGAGAAQAQGFIGMLQDQQNIRNQEANIASLRANLIQLEDNLKQDLERANILQNPNQDHATNIFRDQLQVAQARQALYGAEGQLLNLQNNFQARIDGFKLQLGLPPHLCVELNDPLLDQFSLIDQSTVKAQEELNGRLESVGHVNFQLLSLTSTLKQLGPVPTIFGPPASIHSASFHASIVELLPPHVRQQLSNANSTREFAKGILDDIVPVVRADVEKLKDSINERKSQLQRLRDQYPVLHDTAFLQQVACQQKLPADVSPEVLSVARFDTVVDQLNRGIDDLETRFREYDEQLNVIGQQLNEFLDAPEGRAVVDDVKQAGYELALVLRKLSSDVLDLSLLQARARAETVQLVSVDLTAAEALKIASQYRRDWMNARARLVDAWRLIEFNADNLEGFVNIVFDGEMGTLGDNPVKFRDTRGSLRVGLQFDAPITRLQERNTYRQSLIEFQQARRDYYQFVDRISLSLRSTIRTMELDQLNFEARRVAVLAAIEQIRHNINIRKRTDAIGGAQGVTAARDIVSALSDLQNAQNDFLSVWVNFEVLRRSLDFDLGTMQLDGEGLWLDPGPVGGDNGFHFPDVNDEHFQPGFLAIPPAPEMPKETDENLEVLPPGLLDPDELNDFPDGPALRPVRAASFTQTPKKRPRGETLPSGLNPLQPQIAEPGLLISQPTPAKRNNRKEPSDPPEPKLFLAPKQAKRQ